MLVLPSCNKGTRHCMRRAAIAVVCWSIITKNRRSGCSAARTNGRQRAGSVIDAVGVDANRSNSGPAAEQAKEQAPQFDQELEQVAPETNPKGPNWHPGDAPSQSLIWAVESIAKAGTLSLIGVYSPPAQNFPIGQAMNKNLVMRMGNTPHRAYIPRLVDMVRNGTIDPA